MGTGPCKGTPVQEDKADRWAINSAPRTRARDRGPSEDNASIAG